MKALIVERRYIVAANFLVHMVYVLRYISPLCMNEHHFSALIAMPHRHTIERNKNLPLREIVHVWL